MACERCILRSPFRDPRLSTMGPRPGPSAKHTTLLSFDGLTAGFLAPRLPSLLRLEAWADQMIRILLHEKARWTLRDLDHRFKSAKPGSLLQQPPTTAQSPKTAISIPASPVPLRTSKPLCAWAELPTWNLGR